MNKQLLGRVVLYSLLVASVYVFYTMVYLDPCQRTQTYSIGTIYPKNAIEQWRLEELLWTVENLWEKPGDTSLFRKVDNGGDITVNIIRNKDLTQTTPGESFEKGSHFRGEINIYHYEDEQDLIMVLAHEFGHTLGLGHVPGDESIMASSFVSHTVFPLVLTSFDLDEFRSQCRTLR